MTAALRTDIGLDLLTDRDIYREADGTYVLGDQGEDMIRPVTDGTAFIVPGPGITHFLEEQVALARMRAAIVLLEGAAVQAILDAYRGRTTPLTGREARELVWGTQTFRNFQATYCQRNDSEENVFYMERAFTRAVSLITNK